MRIKKPFVLLLAAVFGGLPSLALAETASQAGVSASELQELKAQIQELRSSNQQLQSEVRGLRADHGDNWLNQRRTEEVKALVRDVLADADTRASLLAEEMTAGHNGKHFFLASEDGSFLMDISGQIQVRYIWNQRDRNTDVDDSSFDQNESGFQIRRTKLNFAGHIGSPRVEYDITLAAGRKVNDMGLEDVTIGYKLADNVKIEAGRKKLPFLREELTSSKRQLAVDRATITEVFTLNRGEGVWLDADWGDMLKSSVAISDGSNSGNIGGGATGSNDFDKDRSEFAVTGRADVKFAGDWKQKKDFAAWSGEPFGAFFGAAVHYEAGETGDRAAVLGFDNNTDYLAVTIDGSIEVNGFNIFAAYIWGDAMIPTGSNVENQGAMVQGGYMVVPDTLEPYVRYEWIDMDGMDSSINIITVGVNWYQKKHNSKLTVDFVYALDPLPEILNNEPFGADGVSGGLGLRPDQEDRDGQWALRAQYQLLF